jgi:hypothetical protein
MRKIAIIMILGAGIAPFLFSSSLEDYSYVPLRRKLKYAEEFYSLFRMNMHMGTENLNANIFWLLHALDAPFATPVKALAKIETPRQWEKYKNLFTFQIYYLITDTYLRLGMRYEKPNILFFNYKFKKEIEDGLKIAKIYYERAGAYWKKAEKMIKICWQERDIELQSVYGETDKWMDRVFRFLNGNQEMNYPKEIQTRISEVENKLQRLEKGEYKK